MLQAELRKQEEDGEESDAGKAALMRKGDSIAP